MLFPEWLNSLDDFSMQAVKSHEKWEMSNWKINMDFIGNVYFLRYKSFEDFLFMGGGWILKV